MPFPLTAQSFVHAKKEALAKAKAANKALPPGFVPNVDLTRVKYFGHADDNAEGNPKAPSSLERVRRAALEKFEEARREEVARKAREEKSRQVDLENERARAEMKAREAACKLARQEAMDRALSRKRKGAFSDDEEDEEEDRPRRRLRRASPKEATGVKGDARVYHGKARWRPMVVDSDDEHDPVTSPRAPSKGPEANNKPAQKRKRDADQDSDEKVEDEPSIKRTRIILNVRPESARKNKAQKVANKAAAKAPAKKANKKGTASRKDGAQRDKKEPVSRRVSLGARSEARKPRARATATRTTRGLSPYSRRQSELFGRRW